MRVEPILFFRVAEVEQDILPRIPVFKGVMLPRIFRARQAPA